MAGIFKAYDVRGLYPSQLNEDMAYKIGLAAQHIYDDEDRALATQPNTIVVSRDMRSHSVPLEEALINGLRDAGFDVLSIGLATTPMNYFAVGYLGTLGGVNPPLENRIGRHCQCGHRKQELRFPVLHPQRHHQMLEADGHADRGRRHVGDRQRRHRIGALEITGIL